MGAVQPFLGMSETEARTLPDQQLLSRRIAAAGQ